MHTLYCMEVCSYREKPVVYESVGGGSTPECEMTGIEYEEIDHDELREPKKQPPARDYELCPAYGPVNRETLPTQQTHV